MDMNLNPGQSRRLQDALDDQRSRDGRQNEVQSVASLVMDHGCPSDRWATFYRYLTMHPCTRLQPALRLLGTSVRLYICTEHPIYSMYNVAQAAAVCRPAHCANVNVRVQGPDGLTH
jgi:hypothetical protein